MTEGGKSDIMCGVLKTKDFMGEVAIKRFRGEVNTQDSINHELKIWRLLDCHHENILRLLGVVTISDYLSPAPVSKFCKNGNANKFVRMNQSIDLQKRLHLLIGVANGLHYIHDRSILHGDLKGHNIMVDDTAEVAMLCDFGSSIIDCDCSNESRDTEGSIWWNSPELWEDEEPAKTKHSDIWALACVIVEIQTGKLPYNTTNPNVVSFLQARGDQPASADWLRSYCGSMTEGLWNILDICWDRDPKARPSAANVSDRLREMQAVLENVL